ncbi:MAG: biotin transporter BioY [Candidatus Zixiibacteriota bacterium]
MSISQHVVASRFFIGEVTRTRQMVYMLAFNAMLVLSAYVQFPLPFSPVPVTAQTMAVLACGLFLGPTRGALTVIAYLIEGIMGLPVFAGGAAGMARLLGPTGGFLIGFVAAAYIVGLLSAKTQTMGYGKLTAVLSLGTAVIFIPGLAVLSLFAPQGSLLTMGLYPFLPGAAVKVVLMSTALSAYKRIRRTMY